MFYGSISTFKFNMKIPPAPLFCLFFTTRMMNSPKLDPCSAVALSELETTDRRDCRRLSVSNRLSNTKWIYLCFPSSKIEWRPVLFPSRHSWPCDARQRYGIGESGTPLRPAREAVAANAVRSVWPTARRGQPAQPDLRSTYLPMWTRARGGAP